MLTAGTVAESDLVPIWVPTVAAVQTAIRYLIDRRSPFFPGYLHLRQQAGLSGSLQDIRPVWAELGKVLEVPEASHGKPYVSRSTPDVHARAYQWAGTNIAGSFGPASLRPGQIALDVVSITPDKTYLLYEDHAHRALEHLLFGQRMSAAALAMFVLRDFGIVSSEMPQLADFVLLFRERYGITDQVEFDTLYSTQGPIESLPGALFQPLAELMSP